MAGAFEKKSKGGFPFGSILLIVLGVAVLVFGVTRYRASLQPKIQPSVQPTVQKEVPLPAPQPTEPKQLEVTAVAPAPEPAPEPEPEPIAAPPAEARVTLMAVGDNLIHNTVYWSAEQPDGSYDFTPMYADIKPFVSSYDIACINQETIFVKNPAEYDNYPRFGSPTAVGDALVDAGFDVIEHATNHCYDKLDTGIGDSLSFWRETHPEITVLGIHDSQQDADTVRVVEKNGVTIAFLNYTYGLNYQMPANAFTVDQLKEDKVNADILKAKELADFVIVFVHWGTEDSFTPDDNQKHWAQFFADRNVDAVIGAHSHLLQPLDTFTRQDGRAMPVFYSLGNFLSHQMSADNMLGGLASMTLVKRSDGNDSVENVQVLPVVNFLSKREGTWWSYRMMLLRDYTEDMAKVHRFPEATVEYLWKLFEEHSVMPQ